MRPSTRTPRFVPLRSIGAALAAVLMAGACSAGGVGQDPSPSPTRTVTAPLPDGLETVPPSDSPVVGEVPEAILLRIREDLAARAQGDVTRAVIIVAKQEVWSDGSLGCPERGVLYIQAVVPGYQVILELGGQRFDYRADERGIVRLCEPRAPAGQP